MSLLQFKPAPMYILDEIDAALDLQHTQHIGQLFRNRFKGSQFIVVSLKEGLFTNANVLFRARFRDGTSVVEVGRNGRKRSTAGTEEMCSGPSGDQRVPCTRTKRTPPTFRPRRARVGQRLLAVGLHWLCDNPILFVLASLLGSW
jgi:structural maintenance of chromosome 2